MLAAATSEGAVACAPGGGAGVVAGDQHAPGNMARVSACGKVWLLTWMSGLFLACTSMASMPAHELMMDDEDDELEDSLEGEEQDDGKEEEYDRRMFGISQALPVPEGPLPELGDDGKLDAAGTAAGMQLQKVAHVCSQGRQGCASAALLVARTSTQQA